MGETDTHSHDFKMGVGGRVWQAEAGINQGHSRGALSCLGVEGGRASEGFPEEVGGEGVEGRCWAILY